MSVGVSVGANTLVFGWLQNTVLDPYPAVRDADRLIALNERAPDGGEWTTSYPVFRDWAGSGAFEGVAAWTGLRLSRRGDTGVPARDLWTMLVSADYFDVLGVRLAAGRSFSQEDERVERPVVVLTHSYWMREFGGSPSALGASIDANGVELTVIGIGPEGFHGTYVGAGFDAWVPVTLQPRLLGEDALRNRQARWLQVIARLPAGMTVDAADRDFDAQAHASSLSAGDVPVTGARAQPLRRQFLGSLMLPLLSALLGITGLIVLIACINVSGLQLARSGVLRHEQVVRGALGASPSRLLAGSVIDSLLLALPGFLLALALILTFRNTLGSLVPPVPLRVELPMSIDLRVIAAAGAVTLLATILSGAVPAWRSAHVDPADVLRRARSAGPPPSRMRDGLAVLQLGIALIAIATAALFARSIRTARQTDLGFASPQTVLLAGTELSAASLTEGITRLERLVGDVTQNRAVASASVSTMIPLGFGGHRYADVRAEGFLAGPEDNVSAERVVVGAGYFSTMGTPIVEGREFDGTDREGAEPVAIVNESFVRRFWPDGPAIGRTVTQGGRTGRVIGIARDGRYRDMAEPANPLVYWPIAQVWESRFTVVMRLAQPPAALMDGLRRAFANAGNDVPLLAPRTLSDHIRAATFVQETGASVLGAFAVIASLMAAVGLYGILAQMISARTAEFGVRLALGARRRGLVGLVLRRVSALALFALILGVPGASGVAWLIRDQVTGIAPVDPRALITGALTVLLTVAFAAMLPAVRVSSVPPSRALRE